MSYLLTQMFLYMLATFVLGLLLGWLFWRFGKAAPAEFDALKKERDTLKTDLDACRQRYKNDFGELETLRAENADLTARVNRQSDAMPAFAGVATKPEGLSAPRGGMADPLQEVDGIGPKMERMLHGLGYFHFDQIAAWSPAEVAWVDDNLEGFKGRVTRDEWIAQAKVLAAR